MPAQKIIEALKALDTPTSLPLEKEARLLETSKTFLDHLETPEFRSMSYDAKFTLIYMTAQIFSGTPNGELEAPRLIPGAQTR